MVNVLLIGFEYRQKHLPGTVMDLYRSWKYFNQNNFNISIITDICRITGEINLSNWYKDNQSVIHLVKNYNDFFGVINRYNHPDDCRTILYYTGHGVDEGLVLPDGNSFSFITLHKILSKKMSDRDEIYYILDCCYPNSINLPFHLANNIWNLVGKENKYFREKVMVITSSEGNKESLMKDSGSLFSRIFFQLISLVFKRKKSRNLTRFLRIINKHLKEYNQVTNIYSSHIVEPILWSWLGANYSYDIITVGSYVIISDRNKVSERRDVIGSPYAP
jgi:hypothetical protein